MPLIVNDPGVAGLGGARKQRCDGHRLHGHADAGMRRLCRPERHRQPRCHIDKRHRPHDWNLLHLHGDRDQLGWD